MATKTDTPMRYSGIIGPAEIPERPAALYWRL